MLIEYISEKKMQRSPEHMKFLSPSYTSQLTEAQAMVNSSSAKHKEQSFHLSFFLRKK